MKPIDIIKDAFDIPQKQERLKILAKNITRAVTSEDGYGFVDMTFSEKQVMFPILEGLQIPFSDQEENGVIVGDDIDKIEEVISKI